MTSEEFKKKLKKKLEENRKAFKGKYSEQLNELLGLSKEEIDSITPDMTDLEIYSNLISLVKEATKSNLKQAQLVKQITDLGEVAVQIAKKVPSLAALFV
jgi:predicted house-cleaning noncanonical NTP pyrophosphatase (MazG superfamily)